MLAPGQHFPLLPNHHLDPFRFVSAFFLFSLPSARDFFFLALLLTHSKSFTAMVASAISASARLQDAGQYIMYYVFGLVVQTFFFGAYFFFGMDW
jgi:hypothetical protein